MVAKFWINKKTRELIRIERQLLGFLSFSVRRDRKWWMNPHIWHEDEFQKVHEPCLRVNLKAYDTRGPLH